MTAPRGDHRGGYDRRVAASLLAIVGTLVVGIGIGFAIGHATGSKSSPDAKTVTNVVTATETAEDTSGAVLEPPPGKGIPCAPGPGKRRAYEPNESAADAAGPLVADEPLPGELRRHRDADYWAFCAATPVEVTITVKCRSGACGALFGSFPADASFPTDFDTERSLVCQLPRRGRYVIAVDSDQRPVAYRVSVTTVQPQALLARVPEGFPDAAGEGDVSC